MNNRNYNKVPRDRSKVVKRAKKINISAKALEDFIWTSYRYCIGRKTGAAFYHAGTIAKVIMDNPDFITEERKQFNAMDIRREVNHCCTWSDSIKVEGCKDMDVFSAVLYKSAELDNPYEWIYEVDTRTGNVRFFVNAKKSPYSFDQDYLDLIPWVKLANWLDRTCHKMITVEVEGKESVMECYPYPQKIDGKYRKVWECVDEPNITQNNWLAEEYITKIEDIDNGDKN